MADGLVQLLGSTLLSGAGEVATADALKGKEAVALYFSAHWCPPCRGFTPQLAKWYTDGLKDKLEIVFASSDRDEKSFKEYFGEMPWKALPYSDRELKDKLSKSFKVRGIPTVVILDAQGKVITTDGRSAICSDPTGQDFPWKPKTFKEILATAKFVSKSGPIETSTLDGKVLGLYFSAHWCPPCQRFTPKLAQWYEKSFKEKGLEVVFVSSDKSEEAFQGYYNDMPWLALDYSCRKEKEQLSKLFGIEGIPSLVILDKDGSIINKEGVQAVSGDEEGADFPWYPKPVQDLANGPGALEDGVVVVGFCETADEATTKTTEEAMEPVGSKFLEKARETGEDPEVSCMIAKSSGGIPVQLRNMMGLPAVGQSASLPVKLMLLNLPDGGAYYEGPEGNVTTEMVEKLIADFKAGTLERKTLRQ